MNERVLVVDDDRLVLFGMQRTRKRVGYHLDTAGSALEALEMLRERDYAVVVTDYEMPGINGLELLDRCRTRSPDTVTMMLSAAQPATVDTTVLTEALFRFICKPCLPTMLASHFQDGVLEYRRRRASL